MNTLKTDFEPLAMNVEAAARASGIGRTRLFEAISAGRLKAVKHGHRTLIRTEDLRAYLDALPAARPTAEARAA